MRKAAALKRPSALLRGNRRTALRFADPQSCDPNRHASLFHGTKHTQTNKGASRYGRRLRTRPRPVFRCDPRPRTRPQAVRAHASYEHALRAALERTASQHGASPIPEQPSTPAQALAVPGRRPPQDAPSPVLARGASQDGARARPSTSAVLGHGERRPGADSVRARRTSVPEQNVVPAQPRSCPGTTSVPGHPLVRAGAGGIPGRSLARPSTKSCPGTPGRRSGATGDLERAPGRARAASCPSMGEGRARTGGAKR